MPKVVFCIPSINGPFPATVAALEASVPFVEAAGYEHQMGVQLGPYISHNRALLCRKALDAGADVVVFIDHDMSWDPEDLVTLLKTEGDVVAGTYRYKTDIEDYMGAYKERADGRPWVREDGAIQGARVPAGFLKVTRNAIRKIMREYPELVYGDPECPSVDLFQHGAHKGVWYGEDMAFSRRWTDCGGQIWILPKLNLNHHSPDKVYPGNYDTYLRKQPGGDLAEVPHVPG
jgi:hypothetical protein